MSAAELVACDPRQVVLSRGVPMHTTVSRHAAHLTVTVLLVLLVGGCAGQDADQAATPQPTTSTAASTTVAPTTTTVPPLTAKELAWLKALSKLDAKAAKAMQGRLDLTIAKMRSLADAYRSCTRELQRMGVPSDRLRPVYVLAKKGCRQYHKGAQCWDTAARLGYTFVGSAAERKSNQAIDCAFDTGRKGTEILVDALNKGDEIKAEIG
jgi:hypothetical protein